MGRVRPCQPPWAYPHRYLQLKLTSIKAYIIYMLRTYICHQGIYAAAVRLLGLKLLPRRCSLRLSGAELRSLWEQMAAEQAAEEAQERERMKRLAAELLEFNQLKQMEMSEKSRRER